LPAATDLLARIDNAQLCSKEAEGRYADGIADLEETMQALDPNHWGFGLQSQLATHDELTLELDASRDGQYYTARLRGPGLDAYIARGRHDFLDMGYLDPKQLHERCVPDHP
jgi:hypothetical protein